MPRSGTAWGQPAVTGGHRSRPCRSAGRDCLEMAGRSVAPTACRRRGSVRVHSRFGGKPCHTCGRVRHVNRFSDSWNSPRCAGPRPARMAPYLSASGRAGRPAGQPFRRGRETAPPVLPRIMKGVYLSMKQPPVSNPQPSCAAVGAPNWPSAWRQSGGGRRPR